MSHLLDRTEFLPIEGAGSDSLTATAKSRERAAIGRTPIATAGSTTKSSGRRTA